LCFLNQTNLSYKIDYGLKTIITSIQRFGKVVVESKPGEMAFLRKKDKQAQMMVTELSPAMSVENIQLNLKQMINTKGRDIRGCSLLLDGRMVLSASSSNTVLSMSIIIIHLVFPNPDDTATLLVSLI
jgi:hypothetical protein